jgi:hypothetical protein
MADTGAREPLEPSSGAFIAFVVVIDFFVIVVIVTTVDCGVYVLATAQVLADWTIDTDSLAGSMTPTDTNTTLTGLALTDMLEQQLQQRMTNRDVLFA